MRIAIDAMILVKKIQVEACYPHILDEVVLAGSVGNPIPMDVLTEASSGANPGPSEGDIMRHINQEDVLFMASRAEISEIRPRGGLTANGEPLLCPREAARLAVEEK